MKCLLVDDEAGIREGLAALLRQRGHWIVTASDCRSAAAALASETFDVVVSDWRLPDGLAASFLRDCPCPVLAVSGHPDEVVAMPAIAAVMTKPVLPGPLLQAIAAVVRPAADSPSPAVGTRDLELGELPVDVQRAVQAFLCQLPPEASVELHDDGVLLRVAACVPRPLPGLRVDAGDLDRRRTGLGERLELRLCRDGRPRLDLPVIAWGEPWPVRGEFALDLHGAEAEPAEFAACCRRALLRTVGRVQFLNLPAALIAVASQGTAHDMPMRDPVGPRLAAESEHLWSQP